ncbi:hypothetical protein BO94DRAFT_145999 [Aspergillus sclerotioniger CBS 115572]|uniref:Uncharacterized protein n=1 Tax=Aspergillus sclerotioniger CBS 115572 TaxID=1450535 RepID=A0A317W7A9_9EURO|nr:hypothetical protein BO94DRAFT_145999 [Aspergillus sclerotioniger CBS 115572]PWY81561.1 hypothetical protein BO94DRAFT_145999 [Aspergillus sclerotioniger CBS 115572]
MERDRLMSRAAGAAAVRWTKNEQTNSHRFGGRNGPVAKLQHASESQIYSNYSYLPNGSVIGHCHNHESSCQSKVRVCNANPIYFVLYRSYLNQVYKP